MNANLAALAYLVSGVLFILALRGPVQPGDQPARQPAGHDRHGAWPSPPRCATLWQRRARSTPLTLGLIAGGVAIGGASARSSPGACR